MPPESSVGWQGPSKHLPAALNLPREDPPAVEKPLPCLRGLSQPGFVLPLRKAESGRGQVPGDPAEMRELPASLSSRQARPFRGDEGSQVLQPHPTGNRSPASGAVNLGLRATDLDFF